MVLFAVPGWRLDACCAVIRLLVRALIRCRGRAAVRSTLVTLESCRHRWLERRLPHPQNIAATRIPVRLRTAQ